MATKVSICSNALLLLGDKTINSLDEGTDRASLASNLYDSVRDSLLRSHPWNCAVKRVILAPDTETPPVVAALATIDPDTLSPREALDLIYQLKKLT